MAERGRRRSRTRCSAVSCASTALCVAADGSGNVLVSTTPSQAAEQRLDGRRRRRGRGAGCRCRAPRAGSARPATTPGTSCPPAIPAEGAAAWALTARSDGQSLDGISCPTAGFCAAVDAGGEVVTSTSPSGPASSWVAVAAAERRRTAAGRHLLPDRWPVLRGRRATAACSAPAIPAAGPARGRPRTSTDQFADLDRLPVDKALRGRRPRRERASLHRSRRRGRPRGGRTRSTVRIRCPRSRARPRRCASRSTAPATCSPRPIRPGGAGSLEARRHHVAERARRRVVPIRDLCVAVDSAGNVLSSTNPTGGAAAWKKPRAWTRPRRTPISCVGTLCAAVDSGGGAVTSTDPAAGAGARSPPSTRPAGAPTRLTRWRAHRRGCALPATPPATSSRRRVRRAGPAHGGSTRSTAGRSTVSTAPPPTCALPSTTGAAC